MIVTCTTLADAGLWDLSQCCASCHGEEEAGYQIGEVWPPRNRWGKDSKVWASHCCTNETLTFNSPRDDWARIIWAIRKRG
jgi:hypothetical protein